MKKRIGYTGSQTSLLANKIMEAEESLDGENRISALVNRRSSDTGAPVFSSVSYTFDAASRRDTAKREPKRPADAEIDDAGHRPQGAGPVRRGRSQDNTYWDYDYTDRGQVTGAVKKLAAGTNPAPSTDSVLAGLSHSYAYDDIGNRESWTSGGGPAVPGGAAVSRTVSYTANALNHYTSLSQSARNFDVIGRAPTADPVLVNGSAPYEQALNSTTDQFRALIGASGNGTTGSYTSVYVQSNGFTVHENSGLKWTPATTVTPQYDLDGNLISDGRWTYTWDAENRLIKIEHTGSTVPAVSPLKVEFLYDAYGRRMEKAVSTQSNGTWSSQYRERYLYDGWNPVGAWRRKPADTYWKLHQTYVWGPDIAGGSADVRGESYPCQSAGGVGGLALILSTDTANVPCGGWFPCYDGNGNITALVEAQANGATAALYDYDTFGNPTRMSGPAAKLNPFRFSTKFTDNETELVYYGYRYYDPVMGRWLSRDPVGERGGENIMAMCANNGGNLVDILGEAVISSVAGVHAKYSNPESDGAFVEFGELTGRGQSLSPIKGIYENDCTEMCFGGSYSYTEFWTNDDKDYIRIDITTNGNCDCEPVSKKCIGNIEVRLHFWAYSWANRDEFSIPALELGNIWKMIPAGAAVNGEAQLGNPDSGTHIDVTRQKIQGRGHYMQKGSISIGSVPCSGGKVAGTVGIGWLDVSAGSPNWNRGAWISYDAQFASCGVMGYTDVTVVGQPEKNYRNAEGSDGSPVRIK